MADEQQQLIRIRFSRDQLTVTKISDAKPKPFERKEGLVKLELTVAQIFHKVLNKARVVDIFKKDDYKVLGETLYKILMQDPEVKKFFLPEFKTIYRDKQMRCRISLEFDSDTYKLAALPWEYLRIDENKEDNVPSFFIAADTNRQYDIMRTIDDGLQGELIDHKNQKEINVIAVSINTSDRFAIENINEYRSMLSRLYRKFGIENSSDSKFNYIPIENPYFRNLSQVLDEQVQNIPGPYVLHFFGHAKMEDDKAFIGFINDSNAIDWIDSQRFAGIFSPANRMNLSRNPALVVLQACESGQVNEEGNGLAADLVRQGIPAVLAMQNEITETTSLSFISKFYEDLVNGFDVAQAVTRGRYFLGCEYNKSEQDEYYNSNSFGTPVLFISTNFPIQLMPKQETVRTDATRTRKKCQKCGKIVPSTSDETHRLNNCGGKLIALPETDAVADQSSRSSVTADLASVATVTTSAVRDN